MVDIVVFIIVAFITRIFEMVYTFLAWRANYIIYPTQFEGICLVESGISHLVL